MLALITTLGSVSQDVPAWSVVDADSYRHWYATGMAKDPR